MKGVSRYKNSKPYSEKFNYPWISVEMKSGKIFLFSSRIERGKIQEAMEINETIYKNIINNVA